MAYRIMQRMETNEVVRAPDYNGGSADFDTADEAGMWIINNAEQFPESSFWVEVVGGFSGFHPAPRFEGDGEENWE